MKRDDVTILDDAEAAPDAAAAAAAPKRKRQPTKKKADVSAVSDVQVNIHAGSGRYGSDTADVSAVSAMSDEARADEAQADAAITAADAPEPHAEPSPLPADSQRPKYVVLDDWHEERGRKWRPGVWHFGIKHGSGDTPPKMTETWICSPLYVDAITADAQMNNVGRKLRFKTSFGHWREWAMPMELLKGDGSEMRGALLSMGLEIDPYNRYSLAAYVPATTPKKRLRCALQTGWADADGKAFVLPDEVIGPKASAVIYQSGESERNEYTRAGTLADWQSGVAALAVGNPLLTLGLCAAFAGPLLARCNAESGGIHFVGDSSTGKTTIIEAACSVWGGANFRRSWKTTANGMEGAAAMFNDSLLALDEISECDPREVGAIVYALANGRGKQRASRSGAARSVTRWCVSVLSSGERTIATTMAEGGHRVKAGQSVRLLDVPAQRKYGAWDELHGHATGAAFSDEIRRQSATNHGHAGRAFLERLTREAGSFSDAFEEIKARPEFRTDADAGQDKRAAARFALLAFSGELAIDWGIVSWPEGSAIAAAAVGFKAWKGLRGKGNLERDQVADRVRSFIERHGDARFSDVDADEQRAAMVRDRAGWWQDSDGRRLYLFTADGMREATKGIDFNRALDVLQETGVIEAPGAGGERAKFRRIGGRGVKVYAVSAERLNGSAS